MQRRIHLNNGWLSASPCIPLHSKHRKQMGLCKCSCDHCDHGDQGIFFLEFACSPRVCMSSLWPPSSFQSAMTCNWGNWLLLKIDLRCLSWCMQWHVGNLPNGAPTSWLSATVSACCLQESSITCQGGRTWRGITWPILYVQCTLFCF